MIENSLWVEKYRPTSLDGYIGNDDVKIKMARWIKEGDIPSLLLSGKAGTGKTTLGKILARQMDCDLLYINASDENNVDTVRDKIKGFASTYGSAKWKFIMLDEADYLTPNAQAALRQIIEAFSKHARFILTCNYIEKIIDPIQSRCVHFEIHPPSKRDVAVRCAEILKTEGVEYDIDSLAVIITDTYPDIRRTIQALQRNVVDKKLAIDSNARIAANYMTHVVDELKSGNDVKTTFTKIRQIIADSRVRTFDDLYRHLFDNLEKFAPDGKRAQCILHIADSQYRSSFVVDKEIEIAALIINILKDIK